MNTIRYEQIRSGKRSYLVSIFDTTQGKVVNLGVCWYDTWLQGWAASPIVIQQGKERTGIGGIVGTKRKEVGEKLLHFAVRYGRIQDAIEVPTVIGANATIVWNDDETKIHHVYISFGNIVDESAKNPCDEYGVPDSRIFFFGELEDEDDYREGKEGWTLVAWELVEQ